VLDEPTTGLDPRSRIGLWEVIRELVARGTTLLLTTQYMEEADQLADQIVVIDRGREIAQGTADQLKAQVGGERIDVVVSRPEEVEQARVVLGRMADGEVEIDTVSQRLLAPIAGGAPAFIAALHELDSLGIHIRDAGIRRPTLDDVFLSLTGHHVDDRSADHQDGSPQPSEVAS